MTRGSHRVSGADSDFTAPTLRPSAPQVTAHHSQTAPRPWHQKPEALGKKTAMGKRGPS